MKLSGNRVLIVGASRGMGKGLAQALARRHCHLVLFSRSVDDLRDDPELRAVEGRVTFVTGDIRKTDDIERLFQVVEAGPPLDGVIVAAGVSRPDFVEAINVKRAIDTIRVNLEGPVRVFYRMLPLLIDRRGTFLVGFSSMAGDRGMPRAHAYCASKAGLDRFLESLRIDLLDRGVQVYTIVPGYIDTPMTAQNRFPMPGIWDADRACDYMIRAIEREQLVIRFPWYHSLAMRVLGLIPNLLYWWLMNRQRSQVKIDPRPGDTFTWPCGF